MTTDTDLRVFYATKKCGCVVAAMVDRPGREESLTQEIGGWYLQGWTINNTDKPVSFTKCAEHS